jgi:hypothetical protein
MPVSVVSKRRHPRRFGKHGNQRYGACRDSGASSCNIPDQDNHRQAMMPRTTNHMSHDQLTFSGISGIHVVWHLSETRRRSALFETDVSSRDFNLYIIQELVLQSPLSPSLPNADLHILITCRKDAFDQRMILLALLATVLLESHSSRKGSLWMGAW